MVVFNQLASITTSLLLEPFTIMKLDFLLVTKLVKLETAPYQDMDETAFQMLQLMSQQNKRFFLVYPN